MSRQPSRFRSMATPKVPGQAGVDLERSRRMKAITHGLRSTTWSQTHTWATGCCVTLMWLVLPTATLVPASQVSDRLTDAAVKQLIEDVNQARDRFEDQLDGKLKSSILRGPRGEVNVGAYLDDLQENVGRLKDRFKSDYSASKEAETVLRQGTDINTFIKAQPKEMKGGSEWDRMASDLGRLASAYGTTFPLPPEAAVRRMNDEEVAKTADDVAKTAGRLKDQVDRDAALAQPARDALKTDLNKLIDLAKDVKSRTSDSRPATAETRDLMIMAGKVGGFVQQNALAPATTAAWDAVRTPLTKLQQAFGIQ